MSNKKIFISHSYKDALNVQLLKGQLASSSDINIAFVSEPPSIAGNIEKSIKNQIGSSAMMIVLLGEHWSKWQEFELSMALDSGLPVVGLLSNEKNEVRPPILSERGVPIVNWNWSEISKILSGNAHTLDYSEKSPEKLENPIIQLDFSRISEELTAYLLNNPNAMHQMSPRKFEELVAYIMEKHGYEVTLTQQSRDGGIDIFALKNEGFGNILTIVDCKKYSVNKPVGIAAVRGMYGTLQVENASHGMIATTSRFTHDATVLAQEYKYQLSLKGHADILQWIQQTKI